MAAVQRTMNSLCSGPLVSTSGLGVKGLGSATFLPSPLVRSQNTRNAFVRRGKVYCVLQEELVPAPAPHLNVPTQYEDSWLEKKSIQFLTNRLERLSGKTTELEGYDGFVDMTRKLVHGLPASSQRDTVHKLLHMVLPSWLLFTFRLVPKATFLNEYYAVFTKLFFRWLIGDTEIREAEVNGVMMRSTVHIKKCRYLENSQCVGLCVNLCKNPTQEFIGKQFGMPLTMNPNFEDMSCDMIYGLKPPPIEEDDAYKQPCYSLCKTAKQKDNCA
ncbi:beta-carotene isomerase [Marchantia polymorpha subsp. ruderalis]|uniref:Beta-carotene isomerase D27-like C-terminal domain-containing protein n=4 Tax=Marchantia polymorpha TaxID=3197 RepID=A0AAF6BNB2_MARPO|nr:hypothetical protein MARPO_0034s0120 [Marchantia polymorpha]BBN13496.1 hypothetical protein Mp_6g03970 [Marchantia polymorpha subsp. ruderalis]|eukprot:PTQ41543.1 hypothetical protein MARPO_0034s0120 [Marchantia polymorpha]